MSQQQKTGNSMAAFSGCAKLSEEFLAALKRGIARELAARQSVPHPCPADASNSAFIAAGALPDPCPREADIE